jgi:hypothetical protein
MSGHWLLAVLAACGFAVWAARLLLVPYRTCPWCKGSRRNPVSGRLRHGDCWFCKGTGRRRVLGAKTAHQMWRARASRQGKDRSWRK